MVAWGTDTFKKLIGVTDSRDDRRRHKRFFVRGGVHLVVRDLQDERRLCILKDVSTIGAGFVYTGSGISTETPFTVDFLVLDDLFFQLKEVSCRVVYCSDVLVPERSHLLKRCGARFQGLTHVQQAHLDYFIKSYACTESKKV